MLFDRTHRTIDQPLEQGLRIAGHAKRSNGMPRVQPPHGYHCACHHCAKLQAGAQKAR